MTQQNDQSDQTIALTPFGAPNSGPTTTCEFVGHSFYFTPPSQQQLHEFADKLEEVALTNDATSLAVATLPLGLAGREQAYNAPLHPEQVLRLPALECRTEWPAHSELGGKTGGPTDQPSLLYLGGYGHSPGHGPQTAPPATSGDHNGGQHTPIRCLRTITGLARRRVTLADPGMPIQPPMAGRRNTVPRLRTPRRGLADGAGHAHPAPASYGTDTAFTRLGLSRLRRLLSARSAGISLPEYHSVNAAESHFLCCGTHTGAFDSGNHLTPRVS